MEYYRTFGGRNQIAIVTLAKPGVKRQVTLMGVMHIGPQRYYDKLQKILDGLENQGWAVHFEGVRPSKTGGGLGDRIRLAFMKRMGKGIKKVATSIGWTYQNPGLTYSKSWENHDMDMNSSLRAMKLGVAFKGWVLAPIMLPLVKFALQNAPEIMFDSSIVTDMGQESILDDRNKVAIDAALAQRKSVVLLWGAGHLKGMVELLDESGYKPIHTAWVDHSLSSRHIHS